MPSAKAKGKARADPPSERTPLLPTTDSSPSTSASASVVHIQPPDDVTAARRRKRRTVALWTLLGLLSFLTGFASLLAASFVPSERETQDLPDSFKYTNASIQILDVGDAGVRVNVSLYGGIEVDEALSIDGRRGKGWWEGMRRSAAHLMLGATPNQLVHVTIPALQVYARGGGLPFLNVTLPSDVVVPLVRGELRPFCIEAVGAPVAPVGEIWAWAQSVWAEGRSAIFVGVPQAQARIPGSWWSKWATFKQADLAFPLSFDVPRLPNFPPPGKPLNLSSLVKLHGYTFTNTDGLKISALASLPNPGIQGGIPFPLPFAIELEGTRMAEVVARTSKIDKRRIELTLDGDIIISSSSDALGVFLRRFLHGEDSPIVVRGLPGMPRRYKGPSPPGFVLHTLPSLALDLLFPAPHPAPQIVQSVTVEGMHIGGGDSIEASGTVVALVQLPPGLESVELEVGAILPDVLIYDGKADESQDRPDPSNPPPRAFARIHPKEYLDSTTARSDDPATPHALVVRAPFEHVPLEILEGRDSIFRAFLSKVIFKGGANAGIGGVVDVKADLGVGGPIEIDDLPVTGDFWVGRSMRLGSILDQLS